MDIIELLLALDNIGHKHHNLKSCLDELHFLTVKGVISCIRNDLSLRRDAAQQQLPKVCTSIYQVVEKMLAVKSADVEGQFPETRCDSDSLANF